MIINRRNLLASIGLTLSAVTATVATAEAASPIRKKHKPVHTVKVSTAKPRHTAKPHVAPQS